MLGGFLHRAKVSKTERVADRIAHLLWLKACDLQQRSGHTTRALGQTDKQVWCPDEILTQVLRLHQRDTNRLFEIEVVLQ